MADPDHNAAPRWVKVSLAVVALLAILVTILVIAGGHGPGRHMSQSVRPILSSDHRAAPTPGDFA